MLKLSPKDKAPKTWKFRHLPLCAKGATLNHCVTPFLYHLVQGTLPYTHVNRILLYARTSLVRFCSEYVSLFL